jgi:hypothetical protein
VQFRNGAITSFAGAAGRRSLYPEQPCQAPRCLPRCMSPVVARLPIPNVRSSVANGGKADKIYSMRVLRILTNCDISWIEIPQRSNLLLHLSG